MNEVKAEVTLEVWADCPACGKGNEIRERANENGGHNGEPCAEKCWLELNCKFCDEPFVVTSITF